jgi:hypothetical protein
MMLDGTNPLPVTVRVKLLLPIFAVDGEIAEIIGTGLPVGVGVMVGVFVGDAVVVGVGVGVPEPEMSCTFRPVRSRSGTISLISPSLYRRSYLEGFARTAYLSADEVLT